MYLCDIIILLEKSCWYDMQVFYIIGDTILGLKLVKKRGYEELKII